LAPEGWGRPKRITPRWLNYERTETFSGAVLTTLAAGAMIAFAAFGLPPKPWRLLDWSLQHDICPHPSTTRVG
jgi:hypothetical protein